MPTPSPELKQACLPLPKHSMPAARYKLRRREEVQFLHLAWKTKYYVPNTKLSAKEQQNTLRELENVQKCSDG